MQKTLVSRVVPGSRAHTEAVVVDNTLGVRARRPCGKSKSVMAVRGSGDKTSTLPRRPLRQW